MILLASLSNQADQGPSHRMSSNSVTAAFWFILEILNDQTLLARVRKELEPLLSDLSTKQRLEVDMKKLSGSALIQAIWAETLRLHVAINIVRSTKYENFRFDNWLIPRDRTIVIPAHTAHMDESAWNTRSGETIHPLNEFWADRFLIHPNNAGSSPWRQDSSSEHIPGPLHGETHGKESTFSQKNLQDAFIPFGGGDSMCPGRHFAKHEAIFSFALLFTTYDIEIRKGTAKPEADLRHFGRGTLPPKGKIPFRIRRR